MKQSKLVEAVAQIFELARAVALIGMVLFPLTIFLGHTTIQSSFVALQDEKVTLVPKSPLADHPTPEVRIESAEISLREIGAKKPVVVLAISKLVLFALLFAWCNMLARLFRNVQKGEIFSDLNLRLIRRAGAIQVASALVSSVLSLWGSHQLAQFLVLYTRFKPEPVFFGPSLIQHLHLGDLTTGMVVLVIAEVFRRGLALQKEADLTV